MAMSDSKATLRTVKRVQFGILSPDEIVSRKLPINAISQYRVIVVLIMKYRMNFA